MKAVNFLIVRRSHLRTKARDGCRAARMIERKLHEEHDVLKKYFQALEGLDPLRPMGKVVQVTGMSIITDGPPEVRIGDLCRVELRDGSEHIMCEIVGFQAHRLVLMPLGSLAGVSPNANVLALDRPMTMPVSEDMLGRVINGNGRPLDGKSPIHGTHRIAVDNDPPLPTGREPISRLVETGVRAIDGMLTVGQGQRLGIFAGTGVGKSTMLGMIARYTKSDINVICLVGERGREVGEFLLHDLGKSGLERSVVFAATSDRPAMEKVNCAGLAVSVAEYFRDRGYNVNLMMDSLTRYCMALREVGIASGDQLGPGGYPPGVWYRLSRLVERCGAVPGGSITGFFTVLMEADDINDPVADNARGTLDGHIMLTRRLAQANHYPAIDVNNSVSRVMDRVTAPEHLKSAARLRSILASYKENEELINLGAYARGSNADVDEALEKMPMINAFLRQGVEERSAFPDTVQQLQQIIIPKEEEYY